MAISIVDVAMVTDVVLVVEAVVAVVSVLSVTEASLYLDLVALSRSRVALHPRRSGVDSPLPFLRLLIY